MYPRYAYSFTHPKSFFKNSFCLKIIILLFNYFISLYVSSDFQPPLKRLLCFCQSTSVFVLFQWHVQFLKLFITLTHKHIIFLMIQCVCLQRVSFEKDQDFDPIKRINQNCNILREHISKEFKREREARSSLRVYISL